MKSYWIRVGPDVLLRREYRNTDSGEGHVKTEAEIGMSSIARNNQKLGRGKGGLSLQPSQ